MCVGFDPKTFNLVRLKHDHYLVTIHTEQYGWIRNAFSANAEMSTQELSLLAKKYSSTTKSQNSQLKTQRRSI